MWALAVTGAALAEFAVLMLLLLFLLGCIPGVLFVLCGVDGNRRRCAASFVVVPPSIADACVTILPSWGTEPCF